MAYTKVEVTSHGTTLPSVLEQGVLSESSPLCVVSAGATPQADFLAGPQQPNVAKVCTVSLVVRPRLSEVQSFFSVICADNAISEHFIPSDCPGTLTT